MTTAISVLAPLADSPEIAPLAWRGFLSLFGGNVPKAPPPPPPPDTGQADLEAAKAVKEQKARRGRPSTILTPADVQGEFDTLGGPKGLGRARGSYPA